MKYRKLFYLPIILIIGGCLFNTKTAGDKCEVLHLSPDQPPTLKKGYQEAIAERLNYPVMARKAGVEGRVFLTYNVNQKGEVIGTNIIRGLLDICDEEAKRLVSTAEFNPAMNNGQKVCAQDTMAVIFRLDN